MITLYLICFVLGVLLSLLAVFAGGGHLHLGHARVHLHAKGHGSSMSALNGFTLPAFLAWFGGAGYLLQRYSPVVSVLVLMLATAAGLLGASLLYVVIFKFLMPHERVLSVEDTRMEGTLARVSDEVRGAGSIGEIIFSQAGTRRASPARSEDGTAIPRGTEVVVLRYERGVATVQPLHELSAETSHNGLLNPNS